MKLWFLHSKSAKTNLNLLIFLIFSKSNAYSIIGNKKPMVDLKSNLVNLVKLFYRVYKFESY